MSDSNSTIFTIPLFPLHTVLFPLSPLQLHIFEERYKIMIKDCIENDQPFGVVLIKQGRDTGGGAVPFEVGCTARIVDSQMLEEGKIALFAVGENRFRLLDYVEGEDSYLIGTVEYLDEETLPSEKVEKTMVEAAKLTYRYLELLSECAGLRIPEIELPSDASSLGFYIAAISQMPAMQKQNLLNTTNPQRRLEDERLFLLKQIEELEEICSTMEKVDDDELDASFDDDAENEADESNQEQSQPRVLFAESLNLRNEFWRVHKDQAKN